VESQRQEGKSGKIKKLFEMFVEAEIKLHVIYIAGEKRDEKIDLNLSFDRFTT
jgi:hypothetical protein